MTEIIVGALRIVFGIFGLAANVVQFVSVKKAMRNLNSFDITVISLNIADAVSSLFFTLYGIARILIHHRIIGMQYLLYIEFGLNFSVIASFNHIIFIALQRMFAIIFPLNIRSIITSRRFKISLAVMWLVAIGYAVTCAFESVDFLAVNSYTILVSGCLLIGLYFVICFRAMRQSHAPPRSSIHGNRSQRRSVLLHSLFVTLGFVVCFFPFAVNYLFVGYDFVAVLVADLLVMLNTFVDVFVYFLIRHLKIARIKRSASRFDTQARTRGLSAVVTARQEVTSQLMKE